MAFFEGLKMTGGYGNGPDIINSCSVNVKLASASNDPSPPAARTTSGSADQFHLPPT